MTVIEAVLIIVGIIIMIGSFFVQEKITTKDIEKISDMSETELNMIVEKQLKGAEAKIDDSITDVIDNSMEIADRALAKETNEKIMAVSEYSDTVLESMNKTHNEIMFLYSMLNDKHEELTQLAGELQNFAETMKNTENQVLTKLADAAEKIEKKVYETDEINETEMLAASVEENTIENTALDASEGMADNNHNERILSLHRMGRTDVEIAKELGLGLGEVKLVIGLFKGDNEQ